ncbi:hypothetical protein CHS0354_009169 [Potamilus streckersoni]|uniref:Uncharacterized protein n=1 Tax=Potamilus streckersoni TaxID=2493646 RepID=A0AAE0RYK3_9BIVA|nr:hypothetical protein CHS0354_009169 [Potamilus streckersoni]
MLSLWTVIALFYRLTKAQLPDQGNAVEFPPSFGMAGGLLSGMLGFVDMFDPSLDPPTPPPGFASTEPPSTIQSSTSAGQVLFSSTGVVDTVSRLNHNIFVNDAKSDVVTRSTGVVTPLPSSRQSPPAFDVSTPVGTTQKPKPRDPFFIDKSSLERTQLTGPTGAGSSQPVHINVTAKDVKSTGQNSVTDENFGSRVSGSGDPLIDLFGGLPSQRRDHIANASVNATTAKATTTTTTTKRPDLPTVPVSNQQILQMLNTFSNKRVVIGKSQGKHEGQKSNISSGQAKGVNKNHGLEKIGEKNSGNSGNSQSSGRGAGLSGWFF